VGAVPPYTGVAVNVVLVPEQKLLPALLVIETDGVALLTVVNLIPLLVAVAGVAQVAFEVTIT
jgi:hypothetical protein